jgi:hypothetical protein
MTQPVVVLHDCAGTLWITHMPKSCSGAGVPGVTLCCVGVSSTSPVTRTSSTTASSSRGKGQGSQVSHFTD